MLYLMPPFPIINGVSLFRDHEDKLQWYFLPVAPKLTRLKDPTTGQRIPQIEVIGYRGQAGDGGFVNFDVNIGVEPAALEDIRAELRTLEHLPGLPRLSPVPLTDGTVRMMLFDRQTGEAPPPPPEGTPDLNFVVKIDQPAKPALYNDNQAAFSVQLSKEGFVALEAALQGEISPIGIVYSLSYLALRPAYSVRLHIDWNRVQKHLDDHYGYSGMFAQVDIDKTVDKLMDERVIDLQADTFVPDDGTDDVITRRDQAVNEVRDMITDAFFQPSLPPVQEQKDGWDKAAHYAERSVAIATTGGWGAVFGTFTRKKVDYTRIDRKALNVNMSERTTVQRTINPQGHLSGLFRPLLEEGLDLNRFVIKVDLDNPWFQRRKVKVISRANFKDDSVGSANVVLRYGGVPKNIILTPSQTEGTLEWPSVVANGAMQRDVTYDVTVNFANVDTTARPQKLVSPQQVVSVENLEIDPRALYSIIDVPVVVPDPTHFPWKSYPQVDVQTRYTDEVNGIRLTNIFHLTEQQASHTWKMFVRDPARKSFQHKLIYRAVDHKDIEKPWIESAEGQVAIRDPFPAKWDVEVVPVFNWALVDRAFVDVLYEDKPNRVSESKSFEFTEMDRAAKMFSVALRNPDLRRVAYRMTALYKDGRMEEVPWSQTLQPRLFVRSDMKGHRIVKVHPMALPFVPKKLKTLRVELLYSDTNAGLSVADDFAFQSPDEQAYFEYDYVDDRRAGYQYQVTYRYVNGMSKTVPWTKSDSEDLALPVI